MHCQIGVIFSLPIEADGLLNRLVGRIDIQGSGFVAHEGALHEQTVVAFISGIGQAAAAAVAERLISGHHPDWLIASGFAASLDPSLEKTHILMADSLVGADGDRLKLDLKITPAALGNARGVHVGRLLTVDHMVRKAAEKRELGRKYEALAVDMESLAVAQICRRENTRFLCIRAITDGLDDELPADIERLLRKKTTARRVGAAAGAVVRRPSALIEIWKLREAALDCSGRLGKFLADVVGQLASKDRAGLTEK